MRCARAFGGGRWALVMALGSLTVAHAQTTPVKSATPTPAPASKIRIESFSEAPITKFNDVTMAKISELGRQIWRLQRQILENNEAATRAAENAQKMYFQLSELRISAAKRMMRQAELDLEANRFEKEASEVDKKLNMIDMKTQTQVRREMTERAAELRLKAAEVRSQVQALSIEGADAQLKAERLAAEAGRENLNASRLRVEAARAEKKIGLLEKEMQETAAKTQNTPAGATR